MAMIKISETSICLSDGGRPWQERNGAANRDRLRGSGSMGPRTLAFRLVRIALTAADSRTGDTSSSYMVLTNRVSTWSLASLAEGSFHCKPAYAGSEKSLPGNGRMIGWQRERYLILIH